MNGKKERRKKKRKRLVTSHKATRGRKRLTGAIKGPGQEGMTVGDARGCYQDGRAPTLGMTRKRKKAIHGKRYELRWK